MFDLFKNKKILLMELAEHKEYISKLENKISDYKDALYTRDSIISDIEDKLDSLEDELQFKEEELEGTATLAETLLNKLVTIKTNLSETVFKI